MIEYQTFEISGLIHCYPRVFKDERGFFLERYSQAAFKEIGIDCDFIQDNFSRSSKNVLRGLHFQKAPYQQDKLVWVSSGTVFDVAVDIREGSATFGRWQSVILSEQECNAFFIPKGFAHGFVALSDRVDLCYKVSAPYNRQSDAGIIWNDPAIQIDWPVSDVVLSPKDAALPSLSQWLRMPEIEDS